MSGTGKAQLELWEICPASKAQGAKAKRRRQSEEKNIAGMSWPAGKTPQFYEQGLTVSLNLNFIMCGVRLSPSWLQFRNMSSKEGTSVPPLARV